MPLFGKVIGQLMLPIVDSVDVDLTPDLVPLSGNISFVMNVAREVEAGASPNPIIYGTAPIVGVLDDEGYLCTPLTDGVTAGARGLYLIATDDTGLNPTATQYTVTYNTKAPGGAPIAFPNHLMVLPHGTTVDLALIIPPDSAPAIGTAAAEAAAAIAVAAAAGAVKLVHAGTNVTVNNTDPQNPVVGSTGGGGGGGGTVDSVNGALPDGSGDVTITPAIIGAASTSALAAVSTVANAAYTPGGTKVARADLDSSTTTSLGKADTALQSNAVSSVAGRTGAVTLAVADVSGAAPLVSATLTGNPTTPTPTGSTGIANKGYADSIVATETTRAEAAEAALVPTSRTVNGHALTGNVTVTASDVSLGSVNNTSDAAKPISTAQATVNSGVVTSLAAKADLVGGVIPTSQIPTIALTTAVPVASQAAMLALTSTDVQPGDLALRSDISETFILLANPPSTLANWTLLPNPSGGGVASVNGQVGTVVLGATDVGLGSVNNTADSAKPVSTAQAAADTVVAAASVPNTGASTIAGVKTFSSNPVFPAGSIARSELDSSTTTSLGKADTALQTNAVSTVAGRTGAVTIASTDITDASTTGKAALTASNAAALATAAGATTTGAAALTASNAAALATAAGLGSVNNTADASKPVSTAQAAADAAVLVSATLVASNPQTGAYTLALIDSAVPTAIDDSSATAVAITIPANATVAFPIGTTIEIAQQGAGQLTITPASGVTINSAGNLTKTRVQYSTCSIRKISTNVWHLAGDLA